MYPWRTRRGPLQRIGLVRGKGTAWFKLCYAKLTLMRRRQKRVGRRRSPGERMSEKIGIVVRVESGPGVLHQLTGVIAAQQGDISSVAIVEDSKREARVYFEVDLPGPAEPLLEGLRALSVVKDVSRVDTLDKI